MAFQNRYEYSFGCLVALFEEQAGSYAIWIGKTISSPHVAAEKNHHSRGIEKGKWIR